MLGNCDQFGGVNKASTPGLLTFVTSHWQAGKEPSLALTGKSCPCPPPPFPINTDNADLKYSALAMAGFNSLLEAVRPVVLARRNLLRQHVMVSCGSLAFSLPLYPTFKHQYKNYNHSCKNSDHSRGPHHLPDMQFSGCTQVHALNVCNTLGGSCHY